MRKIYLKIFVLLFTLLNLFGCTTLRKSYYYTSFPVHGVSQEYKKFITVKGYTLDSYDEKSLIRVIDIVSMGNFGMRRVELLSNQIKIKYKEKLYFIEYKKEKVTEDEILNNFTTGEITIPLYKAGLNINEDFILYLGKIRLDNKIIIEVPPLEIVKNLEVYPYNPALDLIGRDSGETIYRGSVEGYKGN